MLVEEQGQAYSADDDSDSDEARTLRQVYACNFHRYTPAVDTGAADTVAASAGTHANVGCTTSLQAAAKVGTFPTTLTNASRAGATKNTNRTTTRTIEMRGDRYRIRYPARTRLATMAGAK